MPTEGRVLFVFHKVLGTPKVLIVYMLDDQQLTEDNIPDWFNQLNLEGVVLKSPPPSYEFAVAVKESNVIFLIHKNTHVVEVQYTNKFSDSVVDAWLDMDEGSRSEIEYELRSLLVGRDIRHRIIVNTKEKFFGFSLFIYLPKKPSDTSILNSYARILEVRDHVGHCISRLMKRISP